MSCLEGRVLIEKELADVVVEGIILSPYGIGVCISTATDATMILMTSFSRQDEDVLLVVNISWIRTIQ